MSFRLKSPSHSLFVDRTVGRRALLIGFGCTCGAMLAGCTTDGLPLATVSPEQERQMGEETWQRLLAETPVSRNRGMQQALREVGSRILAANGENPNDWEMVVFQGEEANAFALPGGKIGVYEGMFQHAQNEAQLAAVVGHEIGHNQARHAAERLSRSAVSQVGLQAVSAALQLGNIGYANEIAGLLGAGVQYGVILPYGREQELEADRLGLQNMARAGYDPRQSIALWQNMAQGGGQPPEFMSTHPSPGNRIEQLEALLPEAMEIYTAA